MRNNNINVLVHCAAGISRSATIVIVVVDEVEVVVDNVDVTVDELVVDVTVVVDVVGDSVGDGSFF